MNHKSRRKNIRKRYKKIMAALAGAAVMSTTMLPGIPLARVSASPIADTTAANPPASTTVAPSTTVQNGDPLQVVTDNANRLGFSSTSSFRILSQSGSKAVVRVHSNGQTFKVNLDNKDGDWTITALRGIGDQTHPATYIPSSMITGLQNINAPIVPLTAQASVVPVTLAASQQILYQTDIFNNWLWNEAAYPRDLTFGVLLQNPRLNGTSGLVPGNVLNLLGSVNFNQQLVLYAHLGTVAPQGYGIGIARVAQTGNDLTVIVRTKSPQLNEVLSPSKTDDVLPIDRGTLNLGTPVHVTFVDQNGTILSNYTFTPR